MKNLWKYVIIASAVVISAVVLAAAYTQRYNTQRGTISVTGLGETEFTSDLIVIEGSIKAEFIEVNEAYADIERQRKAVTSFLTERGVKADNISFHMPSVDELSRSVYEDGHYVGEHFAGYRIYQSFSIESKDVDIVETAARELPSLLTEGVNIEVDEPLYYYSQLDAVKHDLIAAAAADARERALKIATSSEAELGELYSSSAGVFQITSATGNEEYSWGGSFNLSSRDKKASITIHANYKIR